MGDKKKGVCKTTMAKMTAAPKSKPTSAAKAAKAARGGAWARAAFKGRGR